MEIIKGEKLSVRYDDQIVIENLSFLVSDGDYLCIVGDNGAGKSTLLKCILGLKSISGGSLLYGDDFKKNQIGYVPQKSENIEGFPATVIEVVMSGCLNKHGFSPFYNNKEKKRAHMVLGELDIMDLADMSINELSGGQLKRVMLARALMASERLLVMDEPVAALDPAATREFYATVNKLNREGMTIIMVSHDIHAAVHNATHILHLSNRLPNFFGTKEEYLKSDIGHTYLGSHGDCTQCHEQVLGDLL